MLFDSIVFGTFTGELADYALGRFGVKDNLRIAISVVVGVIVGVAVALHDVSYF